MFVMNLDVEATDATHTMTCPTRFTPRVLFFYFSASLCFKVEMGVNNQ